MIPAKKVTDTIKSVKNNIVQTTIPGEGLYTVATPQFFKFSLLHKAHIRAREEGLIVTDDAGIMQHSNVDVKIIEDDPDNIKLTHFSDLKSIIKEDMRIGRGFDIHRLVPERTLRIGGIDIPFSLGLAGHSDADVLLHAIIDALLGAAGLGDIGKHFPDKDKKYKNINSKKLLKKTIEMISKKDYHIHNLDTKVIAQKPKLSPHIKKLRTSISDLLNIDEKDVNVKAKTTEKLGIIGHELAIAAEAIVLLKRNRI